MISRLRGKYRYEVTVYLCEKQGDEVIRTPHMVKSEPLASKRKFLDENRQRFDPKKGNRLFWWEFDEKSLREIR
jgi:hypothetical protein